MGAGHARDHQDLGVLFRDKGDREGQHSIRINEQWRVCFRWTDAGAEEVEIVDYHKG